MKAFSHGALSQIRSIVMAYELLVSQDLMDGLYKTNMGLLNKDVKKYRDLKIAEYEEHLEGALMGSVVSKPSFVRLEFLERRFQIVYGLFQRKGLILKSEVNAEI